MKCFLVIVVVGVIVGVGVVVGVAVIIPRNLLLGRLWRLEQIFKQISKHVIESTAFWLYIEKYKGDVIKILRMHSNFFFLKKEILKIKRTNSLFLFIFCCCCCFGFVLVRKMDPWQSIFDISSEEFQKGEKRLFPKWPT